MALPGIVLGITVAVLWGATDSIAAFAARMIGALPTTLFSQLAGLLIVAILSLFMPGIWDSFTPLMIFMGACTGFFAALGYYTFYRGLAIGPVSLVSTISSSSSVVTLLLAFLFLSENLSPGAFIALGTIMLGIALVSANLRNIQRIPLRTYWSSLLGNTGIKWALLAVIAFGVMDFSVGWSAKIAGWFLPVFFMRCFSLLFLVIIHLWSRLQTRSQRLSGAPLPKFHTSERDLILSPDKRTVLHAEDIADNAAIILSLRKQRKTQTNPLPYLLSRASSGKGFQSWSNAPLLDVTNKLFPSVNLLPTRSAIGVLARLNTTSPNQTVNTIILPATTTILSPLVRVRGIILASIEGSLECLAVLLFSLASRLASTGITAVLASAYVVISLVVSMILFKERLNIRQTLGVSLILSGICLLALSPI